jgi:hypothetical protein
LGKLTFKCRQLQVPILPGPILCRFVHLMFVRFSTRLTHAPHRWDHRLVVPTCCGRGRARNKKEDPEPISPESSRPVSSRVFGLLIPPVPISPAERSGLKEPPLPGIRPFPAPTNPLSPVIWWKVQTTAGFRERSRNEPVVSWLFLIPVPLWSRSRKRTVFYFFLKPVFFFWKAFLREVCTLLSAGPG